MKPRRATSSDESGKRQAIIDACRMNAFGINQGTSPARQYHGCPQIGKPLRLSKAAIELVRRKMAGYGHADV
jgi:hypothetical protein